MRKEIREQKWIKEKPQKNSIHTVSRVSSKEIKKFIYKIP